MKKESLEINKSNGHITWGPVASIIVLFGVFIGLQFVSALLIVIYSSITHSNYSHSTQWIQNSVFAQFIYVVLIEGATLFLLHIFLKIRKTTFNSLGLQRLPDLKDLFYTLVGFAIYFITYIFFLYVISQLIPSFNANQKQDIGFNSASGVIDLAMVFLSLVLLPPIVEEILFRGFLYTGLKTKVPKIPAAILTSIIFASFHLLESNTGLLWVAGLDTFILSMFLVYLREKTNALYASMGVHMLKNFVAFASLFLFHLS